MEIHVDILINMKMRDKIKQMVKAVGIRQTARNIGIDPGGLYRTINGDLRMDTAETILNALGYQLKIVRKGVNRATRNKPKRKEVI